MQLDPRSAAPKVWVALGLLFALSCASSARSQPKIGPLAPCPDKPNCVSSLAEDADHRVDALPVAGDARAAWSAVREAVAALPRTQIVEDRGDYLHAESKSRIFRFVDDLEIAMRPTGDRIDVRSASRTGYGDWGVNRKRVEMLREAYDRAVHHTAGR